MCDQEAQPLRNACGDNQVIFRLIGQHDGGVARSEPFNKLAGKLIRWYPVKGSVGIVEEVRLMDTRRGDQSWNSYGSEEEWLRLIDFIDPGSKAVKAVIAQAKARAPNGEFPGYVPPDDWRGTIEDLVNLQVEAIYGTLRERRIGYAVERWDSRPPHQVIRTHDELLDANGIGGPCIDLVVLMAACLEALGIQPTVVVLELEEKRERRRHAVLGYRLEELPYGPETPANEIPSLLSKQELGRLKNARRVEFINCTGITRGENVDFKGARDQGKDYLEQWELFCALDVKAARHTTLTREMMAYLEHVRVDALTLPPAFGFPSDVNFPDIRVQVKVRRGERRFSEAEARAWESARREGFTDDESMTRVYERYPWTSVEEKEREEQRPLDWDRQVWRRLERAVILADPGFGKTWLLKHEALELAQEAARKLMKHPLATDEIELPVFVPLVQLAEQTARQDPPLSLDEAMVPALQESCPIGKELKEWIGQNLNSERCVLLLDALDEVIPTEKQSRLWERLKDFAQKHSRTRILLTSRLVGYPGPPFPPPQDGELELLPFNRHEQQMFVRKWFAGQPERGDLFLRKLRENLQLKGLAQVPLLLALMCRLFDVNDELPKSRADLYEACVWGILTREWKTPCSGDTVYFHSKVHLMEEVAFELFSAEKECFYLDDLLSVLQDQPRLGQNQHDKHAERLVTELQEDGLLIKAGDAVNPPYLFLHLTFQEYLTACALARRTRPVDLNGQQVPEWLKLVKPHLFDPRWEEVIRLLASKLKDATLLIQAIWQEPEDLCLSRLFLAGKCTADARHMERQLRRTVVEQIVAVVEEAPQEDSDLLTSWVPWLSVGYVPELQAQYCRILGRLAAKYDQGFKRLVCLLEGGTTKPPTRALLVRALGATHNPAAVPHLLKELGVREPALDRALAETTGKLCSDGIPHPTRHRMAPKSLAEREAAKALGEIGSAAISHLDAVLADAPTLLRRRVAESLGWTRSPDAIPAILPLLDDLVADVREMAAWALGEIRSAESVSVLLRLLRDSDASVRETAARSLTEIRGDEVVTQLLELLKEPDPDIRAVAAGALGKLGCQEAVPHLIRLLDERLMPWPRRIIQALGDIGDARSIPYLQSFYLHSDPFICGDAVVALGKIEEAAPHLIRLLSSADPKVRMRASESLGRIGGEKVVPHLLQMLKDQDPSVRLRTATALGSAVRRTRGFGVPSMAPFPSPEKESILASSRAPSVLTDPLVASLMTLLEDKGVGGLWGTVRKGVVRALGYIGAREAVPALTGLIEAHMGQQFGARRRMSFLFGRVLHGTPAEPSPWELVWEAVWALANIGGQSSVTFLTHLLEAIRHPVLINALGRVGDQQSVGPLYRLLRANNIDNDMRAITLRALAAIARRCRIRILLDGSCVMTGGM